jgi:MoaA/NifB/PqqE/SkfB family radical SAM enzyme
LPDLVRHFGKDSPVQITLQPFVGPTQDPFWVQDLGRFKETLDELRSLKAEGYKLMGDDQQFEGFLDYMTNPPSTGELRHLDLAGAKRNCDIGLRSMFIYPNGDVFFCDFLGRPIGNVHQNSLKEIYRGAVAEQQRSQMVHCNVDCQQTCKRPTPLWVKAATFLRMG